jgi:hypothetical protein
MRGGSRLVWWALLCLVVLGAGAIRIRLLEVPLERDEGEYAYAGQLLLHGIPPYTLAYSLKLPGTYAAYALSMSLFGETTAGARVALLLASAATTVLLFLLGRRLLGSPAGLATAASFACLSLSTEMLGIFGHATHFVLTPAVGGLLALLGAMDSRRLAAFFASGLVLGLAPLMKQPGAVFPLFAAAWLAWARATAADRDMPRLLREGGALGLGAALPLAATVLLVARAGALDTFWLWVVRYGFGYATTLSPAEGLDHFAATVSRFLPQAAVLWGLAGLGLVLVAVPRTGIPHRAFLAALLAFSALGICPGLYFREHYFILALPAVSLLTGAAVHGLLRLAAGLLPRAAAMAALGLLLGIGGGQALASQRDVFFRMSPHEVSRSLYGPECFVESLEIGRHIRMHTRPEDRLVVFGSEPQIYFHARRRSATGHIYMYALMERQPLARRMQEQMIREVEAARPAYAVWVRSPTSWLDSPRSERLLLDWAGPYLRDRYVIVGHVVLARRGHMRVLWGAAAGATPLGEHTRVLVLRRKDLGPPAGS